LADLKNMQVTQAEMIQLFGQSAAVLYGTRNALEDALDAMQDENYQLADDIMIKAYDMCLRMVIQLESHVSEQIIMTPHGETVH